MTFKQSNPVIGTAIRRIACVGAGVIGHSWATFFSMKGYTVYLHDINEEVLQRGLRWIQAAVDLCAEKGLIAERDAETALKRVKTTTDQEGKVTSFWYDGEGRLEVSMDGAGNDTSYFYSDSSDQCGESQTYCDTCLSSFVSSRKPVKIVYPTYTRVLCYDKRQRVVREVSILTTDIANDPHAERIVTEYE